MRKRLRLQGSGPTQLLDPSVPVRPRTPIAVLALSTRETLASPTSRPEARTIFVYPRIGDDAIETPPLRLTRALCVQHRAAIPTKHRVEVPTKTKPAHLHDALCHQCRGDWIANCDDGHERRAIEDTEAESPSPGRIAVLVVADDKNTGHWECSIGNPQPVIQDGSVTLSVIDPAELVPSEVGARAKRAGGQTLAASKPIAAPVHPHIQFQVRIFAVAAAHPSQRERRPH
jgi:hypothetical protein